jgi:uncharacterized protein (DUF885 family)
MAERDPGASSASRRFQQFLDDDWKRWLREYPEVATAVGYPGLNDRWTDDSPAGIERRRRHLQESRTAIRKFDRKSLSAADQLNFDLYLGLLESATEGLEFGHDPIPFRFGMPHDLRMPLNQMDGIHLTGVEMLEQQPHATVADYEAHVARLAALPAAIEQNLALLEAGRSAGFTPPRIALRGVPDQVRGLLAPEPLRSPLLHRFAEFPPSVPPADCERLVAEAVRIYTERIVPAVEKLLEYLLTRYLPDCRETVGVSALPKGAEEYSYLVAWQTTTELSASEIHDIGLREVRRLRAEVERIRVSTGFAGDFHAFTEFLRTDRRFYFERGEELIDAYRVIAKKTDPVLARLFGLLPRQPYGVLPVPEYRAKASPAAYYFAGATATGRAGYFYANTYEVGVRPRWEMEALSFHEAVPGHHLQLALQAEIDGMPEFRKYSAYTAFVEGWGLYAESLGEELGFYQDPYSKVGQLTFDIWRSIRLVVDTGMHAMGWTREQAIQFFRENTGKSDVDIAVEVDRYIVWPGQALAYKIGQLKFRELRTFAEERLGPRFDVREFHDLVLGQGSLPLGEVERRVRAWVADRAPTRGTSARPTRSVPRRRRPAPSSRGRSKPRRRA